MACSAALDVITSEGHSQTKPIGENWLRVSSSAQIRTCKSKRVPGNMSLDRHNLSDCPEDGWIA